MEMRFNFKHAPNNILKVSSPAALVVRLNPEPAIFFETNLLKPGSMTAETSREEIKWTVPGKKVPGDRKAYEVGNSALSFLRVAS